VAAATHPTRERLISSSVSIHIGVTFSNEKRASRK
jgi:hypothetical protein